MIPLDISGNTYFEYEYVYVDKNNTIPYSKEYDVNVKKLIKYVRGINAEIYKFMYDIDFQITINKDGSVTKEECGDY